MLDTPLKVVRYAKTEPGFIPIPMPAVSLDIPAKRSLSTVYPAFVQILIAPCPPALFPSFFIQKNNQSKKNGQSTKQFFVNCCKVIYELCSSLMFFVAAVCCFCLFVCFLQ